MSLILEALKKSEQQRRLGEAPTFGSPVVATRRRRSFLPVLAILIAASVAAAWWLLRPSPTPAPTVASTPVTADTTMRPAAAIATKPAAHAPGAPFLGDSAQNRTKLPADAVARTQQKTEQDKRIAALAKAAHSTPAAGASKAFATTAAPPASTLSATGKPAAGGAAALPPTTTTPVPAVAPQATPKLGDKRIAPAETAVKSTSAAGPALPTIWELPYATRKDLPEIDLSMHVYSADPKARFVVIKGDRHIEGDEVGQDLILREIRQDGVVLEYKGQAFFFPRSGR